MNKRLKGLRIATVIAGVLSAVSLFMNFGFEKVVSWYLTQKFGLMVDTSQADSVAIIGGADGPTAIFVAGYNHAPSRAAGIAVSAGLVLLTAGGAFLCHKLKKKARSEKE